LNVQNVTERSGKIEQEKQLAAANAIAAAIWASKWSGSELKKRSRRWWMKRPKLKLFMYCFNRRQLHKQRFPNYPALVFQFV
jgi:hypothetical protein